MSIDSTDYDLGGTHVGGHVSQRQVVLLLKFVVGMLRAHLQQPVPTDHIDLFYFSPPSLVKIDSRMCLYVSCSAVHTICRFRGICKRHVGDTPDLVSVRRCGQLVVLVEVAGVDVVADHPGVNEIEFFTLARSIAGDFIQERWEGFFNEQV